MVCTPREVPEKDRMAAAFTAISINPVNRPRLDFLPTLLKPRAAALPDPGYLGVLTSKWWGKSVRLSVSFKGRVQPDLQAKILSYMNHWSSYADVKFTLVQSGGQVRISLGQGGYWSYIGTDILGIPQNQPTMNLEEFSLSTPESEYERVVVHETGHTLGCPHEHMRRELVELLDPNRTIRWGARELGWNRQTVMQQILTPIDEGSLLAGVSSPHADATSIMAYQMPGECTRSGQPIPGGTTLDAIDKEVIGKAYPLAVPPPPAPSGPAGPLVAVAGFDNAGKELWRFHAT
jgi:hypothetical protein